MDRELKTDVLWIRAQTADEDSVPNNLAALLDWRVTYVLEIQAQILNYPDALRRRIENLPLRYWIPACASLLRLRLMAPVLGGYKRALQTEKVAATLVDHLDLDLI